MKVTLLVCLILLYFFLRLTKTGFISLYIGNVLFKILSVLFIVPNIFVIEFMFIISPIELYEYIKNN